jgi:hypothetical protein
VRRAMDGTEYANGRRLRAGGRLVLGDAIP